MSTLKTTIELDIQVEYTATKGMKGTRDKYGVPEEPDDDDDLEIGRVVAVAGKAELDITEILTAKQLDALTQEAWEHAGEQGERARKET